MKKEEIEKNPGRIMKVIAEFEQPKNCEECPCCHLTEGAYHDYCGLLGYNTKFPKDFNYFKEVLKNCPLEIKNLAELKNCENCKHWVESFDNYSICSKCEHLSKWE